MIPKNIFTIWLGDNEPSYLYNVLKAYQLANSDFTVNFIKFSIKDIEQIYNSNDHSEIEQLLVDSINTILKTDHTVQQLFINIINHQKICYGKNIVFIQLLSDIFRLKLVNHFGGIYVDCDTFPLKPFDDKLLINKNFAVERHYNTINNKDNLGTDNYFIGSEKNGILNYSTNYIRQTKNKWWIDPFYLYRKKKFFNNNLQYKEQKDQDFYIEHYFDGNWKEKNGKIRTQKCFLDQLF